jgi:putative FmdB family regulatory protein
VPIYEYLCEGCARTFEVKQSMKDDPIAACEQCGKPVRRLISSPAIMFKGSGWYITDYSDKMKPPTESEKTAPTGGEKKDATTTSASPAAATPASPSAAGPASAPASTTSGTAASTPSTSTTTPSSTK